MAPSRNKPPRPPSRSRFQEGSMNDRTSAVPPFQYLDPDQLDEADRASKPDAANSSSRAVPPETDEEMVDGNVEPSGDKPKHKGERKILHKKSSRFLGQVWDGVSRKLGWRKDAPVFSEPLHNQQPRRSADLPAAGRAPPLSREDLLASYNDLVASGFFTSHAIPSARHAPPPGLSRPATSASTTAAGVAWPLPPNRAGAVATEPQQQPLPPAIKSTRRGTKRSAADDDDVTTVRGADGPRSSSESAKRVLSLPSPKKLRKSPSSLSRSSMDKSRTQQLQQSDSSPRSTPRRNLLGLRSSSSAATATSGRLTPSRLRAGPPVSMSTRMDAGAASGGGPVVIPERGSSARRTVSFGSSDRVLRSHSNGGSLSRGNARGGISRGIDQVLQVVPDANRGIPNVPRIPEKFTFGEDRENDGPWRGLKVMPAQRSDAQQENEEVADDESECEMF